MCGKSSLCHKLYYMFTRFSVCLKRPKWKGGIFIWGTLGLLFLPPTDQLHNMKYGLVFKCSLLSCCQWCCSEKIIPVLYSGLWISLWVQWSTVSGGRQVSPQSTDDWLLLFWGDFCAPCSYLRREKHCRLFELFFFLSTGWNGFACDGWGGREQETLQL